MTKEERKICKRLWKNMQKDSAQWVWSDEHLSCRYHFDAKIDGLTLALCSVYDVTGGERVYFRIADADTSKTLSPGFWGRDHIREMMRFLNKREADKRAVKEDCVVAKLSSLLA